MTTLRLEVVLRSPTLIGSGEGFGAVIDSDIVFDNLGLPYIPARRLKGCLKDAAEHVAEMFQMAGIPFPGSSESILLDIFGKKGIQQGSVQFSNLTIKNYAANREWLTYLSSTYSAMMTPESILASFCELRQQTAINKTFGIAEDASLRTSRVLKKNLRFSGILDVQKDDPDVKKALAVACYHLRHIGTKRNRGFGEVECTLLDASTHTAVLDIQRLEELCTA